jgi:hypothetical protein
MEEVLTEAQGANLRELREVAKNPGSQPAPGRRPVELSRPVYAFIKGPFLRPVAV